jgi:hypothetical protein
MSEPDSTPRRRPPTIDLTAKEVETGQAGSAHAAAADAAKAGAAGHAATERGGRNFFDRAMPYAVGIVAGAIAVGAIGAGLWLTGLVPAHESAATREPRGANPVATDEISSRLDRIQQTLQTPRSDVDLTGRMAAAEAQAKAAGDTLTALAHRVDELAAASQSALAQAKAAAVAAEQAGKASQTNVQRSDIEALNNRVAAVESTVRSLATDIAQRASSADDGAARATVAAEALRAAVERGVSYQAELAAVKSLGADQNAIVALAPFAADGLPSAAALSRELIALMPALERAAEPAPNDGSFLGRLETHVQRLVRITPIDGPAPPATPTAQASDDASSAIARLHAEAARGDIGAALADIPRLPEAARALAASWVKKAEAREQAIAASNRIAADALAALGAGGKPPSQ